MALWAIDARTSEFGFSPNRVAALGMNVILRVNLAWSAVLYVRFLRGRGSFAALGRWQPGCPPRGCNQPSVPSTTPSEPSQRPGTRRDS